MEYRLQRGTLSTAYQDIIGIPMAGMKIENINPALSQKISISYLRITALLPSKPTWSFVRNGTEDVAIQEKAELDAWNSLEGNSVTLKIGSFVDPTIYALRNVVGGYNLDLVKRASKGSILLGSDETLQLKLSSALGSGDVVAYQCYGTVFIDRENY